MSITRPKSNQPIPPHAKRVFKGNIFAIYQWQQKLFDGTTTTFEKIKRPDTVNVIPITTDKKIILTQQRQPGHKPFISTAGGRIDSHETPLKAARRELLEETGHTAQELLLWDAIQPLTSMDWVIYTFIAKGCSKAAGLTLDAGEKITISLVTFDEFVETASQDNFRDLEITLKILKTKAKGDINKIKQLFLN